MSNNIICNNNTYFNFKQIKNYTDDLNFHIGFSLIGSKFLYIILPIFGAILNLTVMIIYIKKRKNEKDSDTSMEKMKFGLTVIQFIISIYWFFNYYFFFEVKNILNNCNLCFFFSLFLIFAHSLYWCFFVSVFHNLKAILDNPIDGILNFNNRLYRYLTITILCSIILTCTAYFTNIMGVSPMMSCYVRNYFVEDGITPIIGIMIYVLLQLFVAGYLVNLGIMVLKNKLVTNKRHFRKFFFKYLVYGFIFILLKFPLLALYLLTLNRNIERSTFYSYLSYYNSIIFVTIDFALCLVNILFGQVKLISINEDSGDLNIILVSSTSKKNEIRESKRMSIIRAGRKDTFTFQKFETEVMEHFLRDLFIGICHSLSALKQYYDNSNNNTNTELINYEFEYNQEYKIKKHHLIFEDETIQDIDNISIKFKTFAPFIFKRLIYLDDLNETDLIKSLLPMKNKSTINKSQGQSGNFFICTDDNEFILKTITDEELDLITKMFLKNYFQFLSNNKNSLLCKIYGLFQITFIEKKLNVILMRNVAGKFKPNIICMYDLKGSTFKRKVKFDMEKVQKIVMKDNNFQDFEQNIYLEGENLTKLRELSKIDSNFLKEMGLMDYSLLVLKLSLTEKEIDEIEEMQKSTRSPNKYFFKSSFKGKAYILSIIDYFQKYNFFKRMETNLKFYIGSRPKRVTEISCVPPDIYSSRFIEFIHKITNLDLKENENEIKISSVDTSSIENIK